MCTLLCECKEPARCMDPFPVILAALPTGLGGVAHKTLGPEGVPWRPCRRMGMPRQARKREQLCAAIRSEACPAAEALLRTLDEWTCSGVQETCMMWPGAKAIAEAVGGPRPATVHANECVVYFQLLAVTWCVA